MPLTMELENISSDQRPDFIYGGPFIPKACTDPLVDAVTPRNVPLQAIWQRSFAYYTVRERIPVILTKVIDYMSRDRDSIMKQYGATAANLLQAIEQCTKLKSEIMTNKRMEPLAEETDEALHWNKLVAAEERPFYFTASWVFTECYVYRRLRSICVTTPGLKDFDPFQQQKQSAFQDNLPAMCVVANHVDALVAEDSIKESLVLLLKLALWSNKCDLSLSLGAGVESVADPVKMVTDYKDKVLVDDSGKIADFIIDKSAILKTKIEETNFANYKCSCNRLAVANGMKPIEVAEPPENPDEEPEEVEKPPCPSKMVTPAHVMLDIICDNAGYELFTDLCIGHYLLSKEIVQKVRYHVKEIPWFVSDVTPADFNYVVSSAASASFSMERPPIPSAEPDGEEEPQEPLTAEVLQQIGAACQEYLADGRFEIKVDSFWTSPHVYKNMKKVQPALYRELQFPVLLLFKGDLNYRKLLGEINWTPTTSFEQALQGFTPAPVAALRTVKAELIAGLPKGKWEQLQAADDKWMVKGDYGVIQFCAKKEELKVSDKPCKEFGNVCTGVVC